MSVWRKVLGLCKRTVIEGIEFDEDAGVVVARVRPRRNTKGRCGRCGRRAGRYDRGEGRRRWRALDLGTVRVVLEADAPRVACAEHGPTVIQVPWARHGVGHTREFDATAAWLATHCSKAAVVELLGVAWRTVGSIVGRVWADIEAAHDRFGGLRRIGIDEISYRKGYRYLTVVVDHDSGRLVWAGQGRTRGTVHAFFDALEASGAGRVAKITHITADGADWIRDVVDTRCPQAVRCADPFHVIGWAAEALDTVRRDAWRAARASGQTRPNGQGHGRARHDSTGPARGYRRSRLALLKNPEHLTDRQHTHLQWIIQHDPRLHRAYLLKEGLRYVFKLPHPQATQALDAWISWARRCRIPTFVELQRRIVRHKASILASIEHGLSNGRIESINTKIRLITRRAYGFHSPEPLIALAMLTLGGHPPTLPGRT